MFPVFFQEPLANISTALAYRRMYVQHIITKIVSIFSYGKALACYMRKVTITERSSAKYQKDLVLIYTVY